MKAPFHNSSLPAARLLWPLVVAVVTACNPDSVTRGPSGVIAPSSAASSDRESGRDANWGQRGRLVKSGVLRHVTTKETTDLLGAIQPSGLVPQALEVFAPRYDVDQYTILYTTTNEHGAITIASAAVFVPVETESPVPAPLPARLPLVSFSHGTQTDKQKVPSTVQFINPQGIIQAAHGSVAVLADYVGMGHDAAHIHPYLVADVGAASSLDALRAAKRLVKELGLSLDGRLFIYGYSQGGQVAMALARELERSPRSGFTATAVAPMSGPYAFYEVGKVTLPDPKPLTQAAVAATYLMASYQATYHLADQTSDLLVPPYDAIGERIVTTGMTDAEVQGTTFPKFGRDVLRPAVLEAWLHEPDSRLARALRANETYDWRPRVPMRMYYGEADVTVLPLNTLLALQRMSVDLGAPDVQAIKLVGLSGQALAHMPAQWPAYIAARRWFDTFAAPPTQGDDDDVDDQDDERGQSQDRSDARALRAAHP